MGSAWGTLVACLTCNPTCGGAPVVAMWLACIAGSGGDSVLRGYCRGHGEDESGNLHLDLVEYARSRDRG
jgi:hypothetical protein